ncbi:hypothetical protein [Streptomyces sp. R-74717]|uniref:hypothetical protein n=1 Tax=Streptomyces sp. R-74717 TaxID=2969820 RepID=UPI0039B6E4BE
MRSVPAFAVQLPGIVHRYEAGHKLEFVIAASDSAYSGNPGIKPVTVVSAPEDTGVLELPVVGGRVERGAEGMIGHVDTP